MRDSAIAGAVARLLRWPLHSSKNCPRPARRLIDGSWRYTRMPACSSARRKLQRGVLGVCPRSRSLEVAVAPSVPHTLRTPLDQSGSKNRRSLVSRSRPSRVAVHHDGPKPASDSAATPRTQQ
jgi:hypothetical protein